MAYKSIAHSVIIKGTDLLIPVFLVPILIVRLGPELIGIVGFYTSLGLFLSPIIQYGMMQNGIQSYISAVKICRSDSFVSVVLTYNIFVLILLLCVIVLMSFIIDEIIISTLVIGYIVCTALQPMWFFQANNNVSEISIVNFILKIVFFVYVLMYVENSNDIYNYCASLFLSSFLMLAYQLYLILQEHKFKLASKAEIREFVKLNFSAFKLQLAPNAYNNFSIFFLYYWIPAKEYGYFISAQRITEALSNVGVIVVNSFTPSIISERSKRKKLFNLLNYLSLILILSAIILLISHDYLKLPEQVAIIYCLLCLPLILAHYVYYMNTSVLAVDGKIHIAADLMIYFSIFGFLFSLISIPISGVIGVVLTLTLTRLLLIVMLNKRSKDEFH